MVPSRSGTWMLAVFTDLFRQPGNVKRETSYDSRFPIHDFRFQLAFSPAALTTAVHLSSSERRCLASSSGVLAMPSMPWAANRCFMSAPLSALCRLDCSFVTMPLGVFAGATRAYHPDVSYLSPLSATVGRSGRSGDRFAVLTASARSLPAFTWGSAADTPLNMASTSPLRSAVVPGPAPL